MYQNSNRQLVAGIVAGIVVLSAFVLAGTTVAEPAPKIDICHFTGSVTNPYIIINVSQNAWEDHLYIKHIQHFDPVTGLHDAPVSQLGPDCAGEEIPSD